MNFYDFGIRLSTAGRRVERTTCPNCSESRSAVGRKKKCLTVWTVKGTWSCSHCGWSRHKALQDRGLSLSTYLGRPEVEPAQAWKPVRLQTQQLESINFARLLNSRGISPAVASAERLALKPMGKTDGQGRPVFALVFPYYADGVLVNYKAKYFLDGQKAMFQETGAPQVLYRLDHIEGNRDLIITEGEEDCLSWVQAGFDNAVSVPSGAPGPGDQNVEGKLAWLTTCADYLLGVDVFYLAFDDDPPGRRLRDEVAKRVGKGKCRVVTYQGKKDSNELLVAAGAAALVDAFRNAEPYPQDGIYELRHTEEGLDELREKGWRRGARLGMPALDELFSWNPGMVTVVFGDSGAGKSSFSTMVAALLSTRHGWKCAFFTPEYQPREVHQEQIITMIMGRPMIMGYAGSMSDAEYAKAKAFVSDNFFWIDPAAEAFPLPEILDRAAYLAMKRGIGLLVIDPLNYIQLDEYSSNVEKQKAEAIKLMRRLLKFARTHEVHVILVAHSSPIEADRSGKKRRPQLSDIRGFKEIGNATENAISVTLDPVVSDKGVPILKPNGSYQYITCVIIQKAKNKSVGRRGKVDLVWDPETERLFESPPPPAVVEIADVLRRGDRTSWLSPLFSKTTETALIDVSENITVSVDGSAEQTAKDFLAPPPDDVGFDDIPY